MQKTTLYVRPGVTAIAAVLALSSTSLQAQETTAPAEPVPTAEPVASTPAVSAETVTDTSVTETTTTAIPSAVKKSAKTVTPPASKTLTRAATRKAAAPTASTAAPVGAVETSAPIAEATPATVAPVAPPVAKPPAAASNPAMPFDQQTAEIAFGGALAALAMGGAALLASRRHRKRAGAYVAPPVEASHVARPPEVQHVSANERSAFAWGSPAQPVEASRRMTPTALAKLGPTPDNPSLSLKKRLKRAAFFEQRDRAAATGRAVPVSRSAGLPTRAVEALRHAPMGSLQRSVLQPA